MNKVLLIAVFVVMSCVAFADTTKKDMVCEKTATIQKRLQDKGYFSLLNMKNSDSVIETIWVGGQSAIITALVPDSDSTCILAMMTDTVYNSDTLQGLYKAWDQQETKKKGI